MTKMVQKEDKGLKLFKKKINDQNNFLVKDKRQNIYLSHNIIKPIILLVSTMIRVFVLVLENLS